MITKNNLIVSGMIFLLTFSIAAFFAQIGVDPHHDGIMFKTALDVAEGKTLYTQTYAHYGPISPLIQSLSVLLLGKYVLSIRLITALFYGLISVILFHAWSKFLSAKLSLVTTVLWVCLLPFFTQPFYSWSSVYGLFFLSFTILIFINSFTNKLMLKPTSLVLMGVTSGLAFHSKQPYLLLPISLLTFFILLLVLKVFNFKQTIKHISYFLLGFLLVLAILLVWLFANGACMDYFKQTIWLGYVQGRILGKEQDILIILTTLIRSPLWLLLPIVCIYLVVQSAELLKKHKIQTNVLLLGFSLICLSSIFQYYPIFDYSHLFWAATPALGLFIFVLQDLRQLKRKTILTTAILVFSILASSKEVIQNVAGGIHKATQQYEDVQTPNVLKGLHLNKTDAKYYKDIATTMDLYFKKHPDKHFVINISNAIYMTFTDRAVNMKPMFLNLSGYTSGIYPFEEQFYSYVKENKPLIMVPIETEKDFPDYKRIMELPSSTQAVFLAPIDL